MRKINLSILLGLVIVMAVAASAGAFTLITNRCTSAYQLTGAAAVLSGSDTSAVKKQSGPGILVTKYAKNLRSNIEENTTVNAVPGDTIEFRVTWSNAGEATADTINLNDYVPTVFAYVVGSETFTSATYCNTPVITYTSVDSRVLFVVRNASGTDTGPAASGEIKFRVRVN